MLEGGNLIARHHGKGLERGSSVMALSGVTVLLLLELSPKQKVPVSQSRAFPGHFWKCFDARTTTGNYPITENI